MVYYRINTLSKQIVIAFGKKTVIPRILNRVKLNKVLEMALIRHHVRYAQ